MTYPYDIDQIVQDILADMHLNEKPAIANLSEDKMPCLIGFMDDYSRYIAALGLYCSQTAAQVLETYRRGIAEYGVLKDPSTPIQVCSAPATIVIADLRSVVLEHRVADSAVRVLGVDTSAERKTAAGLRATAREQRIFEGSSPKSSLGGRHAGQLRLSYAGALGSSP